MEQITLLPPFVCPTIMTVCRIAKVCRPFTGFQLRLLREKTLTVTYVERSGIGNKDNYE